MSNNTQNLIRKCCFGVTGVMVMLVCSAQAQEIVSIDFSAAQGYSNGPIAGQNGWTDGIAGTPSAGIFDVDNEALLVSQLGTDATWAWFPFPVQSSGSITVSWDWQYEGDASGTVDVGFCISDSENFNLDGNPDLTWNEQGGMTRMQQNNPVIDVRNGNLTGGGSYEALDVFDYTDGSLISIRMELNLDDQSVDVFASRQGGSEVKLADAYGFRRASSAATGGVNAIALWMSGSTVGTAVRIDNISIIGAGGESFVHNWEVLR